MSLDLILMWIGENGWAFALVMNGREIAHGQSPDLLALQVAVIDSLRASSVWAVARPAERASMRAWFAWRSASAIRSIRHQASQALGC